MRRIVIAALVVALGAAGLALGLSAADAVERAAAHRRRRTRRLLLRDGDSNQPGSTDPPRGTAAPIHEEQPMLNMAQIIGHLGRDPEVRYSPEGTAVANLAVATNETWKDKDGAKQERTEWHRVVRAT